MSNRALAHRYARALSDALRTDEELDGAQAELSALVALLEGDQGLRTALANPAFPRPRREELVREMARLAGLSPKVGRFVNVIAGNDRIGMLPDIERAFRTICDARRGVVEAELVTAVPLGEDQRGRWRQALEAVTGRSVRLSQSVDPEIIGGAVAKVGSTVYDGSLRSRLEGLRRRLGSP